MTENKLELPQGTLDLLILKTVALEAMHGWAISERDSSTPGNSENNKLTGELHSVPITRSAADACTLKILRSVSLKF